MNEAHRWMEQAGYTANHWMIQGKEDIDNMFHEGYAEKHPELLAGFMSAAAKDEIARYLAKIHDAIEAGVPVTISNNSGILYES
jgi:hypothetical protein